MNFMKTTAKKIFLASFFVFAALSAFSLPGVNADIPDASGEYVYYRDYSFNRESYVGFLYYDDSTYEARYFAPPTESLAEKNIDLLFTVDPSKDRLELTGERFVVPPQQDDIEIVNYIHDLIYELSARRGKAGQSVLVDWSKNKVDFMQAGKIVSDNYEQFGGPVQMIYDAAVPIFNLKKIVDYAGKDALAVVTIGAIENSKDSSFAEFLPPPKNQDGKSAKTVKNAQKEILKQRIEIGKSTALVQSVQADKNWSLSGQNVWTLGDSAIVSFQTLALPEESGLGSEKIAARLLRLFASSKKSAYCDWTLTSVHASGSEIKIATDTYNPKTKKFITDIKTLRAAAKNFYGCFSLAVYSQDYKANRGYFDKLAKSYSCKMER